MLKHRLFYGALLIAGLVCLIYADDQLSVAGFADRMPDALVGLGLDSCEGAVIAVVLVFLVVLGTRELHRLLSAAGHAPLLAWAMVANVGLILVAFHAGNGYGQDAFVAHATDFGHTLVWITVTLLGTAFLVARRRRAEGAIGDIATTLFCVLYLGLLPQYLLRLRLSGEGGAWLLLYFLGTVKVCDIGAYFTGRALGRHKLIAWLSPGKTIEGLAGGVACSMIVAVGVSVAVGSFTEATSRIHGLFPAPALACVFGLLMGLAGQGGDLLESLIKRNAQVKDAARVIPAFGGVLDILDSVLVAAPIACWVLLD